MEMISSTSKKPPFSSSSSSSSPTDGLKFGQKIYFEDVGIAAPGKSGGGSSSPAKGKKAAAAAVGQGQPPRCQVEGCKLDLSDAKAYYSRHKVCGVHSKSPKVVVNGLDQRFCQQCSRFHQLPEFDQGKRSCRRRLAGHNERRRKPPPGSLFSAPYGRLTSSVFESGKGSGFVMDFSTYPKVTEKDPWLCTGKSLPHMSPNPPFLQGSSSGTHYHLGPTIPSGDQCFTVGSASKSSGRALSLLSNQTWGPRDGSHSSPFVSVVEGAPVVTTATTNDVHVINQFSGGSPWGYKGHGDGSVSPHEIPPHHMGPSRIGHHDQPVDNQYVELEHSRAFNSSTQFMNWSL